MTRTTAKGVTDINTKKRYYALEVDEGRREASIFIFGDIVEWEGLESDVSSYSLAKQIEALDVGRINVFINSYGGEVAEGLAIYNQLRRHKAQVTTYCEGFACSAASVVFMAGEERVMSDASLLMIHNAWMWVAGDPNKLRKAADDLTTINEASIKAYMAHVNISEDELRAMMDAETWLSAGQALEMGFATRVETWAEADRPAASVQKQVAEMVLARQRRGGVLAGADLDRLLSEWQAISPILLAIAQNEPEPEPQAEPEPAPQPEQEPEPETGDAAEAKVNLTDFLAGL